jgi:PAS domain S-box-containing protein
MIQKNLFRILFVEDVPSDVELAVLELRKEKLNFEYNIVCTRNDLLNALEKFKPDLIISDYKMPSFNGLQALKVTREIEPVIPFILFTGSVNEETAVECLKAGAQDYVIKEHMTRLPFAVKETMEQVRINKEKRASELLLKENEEKLQSIFSAAPVGIGLVVNRVLIEINDTFCNMTGYTRSELIGKSSEILYSTHEEFISTGRVKYKLIEEKGTGSVETTFKCKDGRLINVILSSTPLDQKDHSKGVTFTVLDITERKRSDEALRESQQLFQTLAQVSPVGIFRTQPNGYTTFVNPKWQALSGLSYEEALGFGWLKAVHPDDREKIEKGWQSDVQSKKTSYAEYRFLNSNGNVTWVIGNALPEMRNDTITGYVGTITDITDRKLAENTITESEKKYRGIFENVQDVYYETSIDGTILEVSPSIAIISNGQYQIADLIGRSMFDFYSDPEERQIIIEGLKQKGVVTDFEITLRNKDGSLVPCSISAKFVFNAFGQPEKIIGSLHDITDRKNMIGALKLAKEKAETSDKLKTEFLNNISHEVRTPLNGILGFAEIMSMQDLTEKEKKESMTMLFESSDRLLSTITNYMDISLITSGSLSVTKKIFLPSEVLNIVFGKFERVCLNRKLELKLDIPENSADVVLNSDSELCQKILTHFVDNAVKFTEEGSIHFGYSIKENFLEFYVKDTGIGINMNSFNSIFNRFAKEKTGPFKVSEGSGLGLSIAKGLSEAIGGIINLESTPGAGSCFYLLIPLLSVAENTSPGVPDKEIKKPKTDSLILVAEDDETNFYFLNALLTRETGAKIIHALNGRQAIDIFTANPHIELILMDMKMPEIDGFEATRQIRLLNTSVPIIAITAYAMSGDEERIISAGCDGYLSKPINKKSLLAKIAEYIQI